MTRVQANLVLLLAAAIWGGGFVAQATALDTIGPLWFLGLRFTIAALCVLPFAVWEHRRTAAPMTRRHLGWFLAIGAALFGGATAQQFGLITTTVTNSSFLTGLYVVFVPVISVVVLRRQPHWIIWPTALMATAGIFMLSGGELSRLTVGDGLTILCALFFAVQISLVGMIIADSGRPLVMSTIQFAVCGVCGLAAAVLLEPISWQSISASMTEILYVGIVSCGLAFSLQIIGQRHTTAPQAAIFLSSEALFGSLLAAWILGERIGPLGYAGCALIFAAMLMVEIVPALAASRRVTA